MKEHEYIALVRISERSEREIEEIQKILIDALDQTPEDFSIHVLMFDTYGATALMPLALGMKLPLTKENN